MVAPASGLPCLRHSAGVHPVREQRIAGTIHCSEVFATADGPLEQKPGGNELEEWLQAVRVYSNHLDVLAKNTEAYRKALAQELRCASSELAVRTFRWEQHWESVHAAFQPPGLPDQGIPEPLWVDLTSMPDSPPLSPYFPLSPSPPALDQSLLATATNRQMPGDRQAPSPDNGLPSRPGGSRWAGMLQSGRGSGDSPERRSAEDDMEIDPVDQNFNTRRRTPAVEVIDLTSEGEEQPVQEFIDLTLA